MRVPWRKTNPVGPETIYVDVDPALAEDRELVRQISEMNERLNTAEADAAYWRSMYYSILTIRGAFEHAVEKTGWAEVSKQEKVGMIKPIATQEYPPNEGRPIPNSPDYLGECPPLSAGDIRKLHSYHEGPGL